MDFFGDADAEVKANRTTDELIDDLGMLQGKSGVMTELIKQIQQQRQAALPLIQEIVVKINKAIDIIHNARSGTSALTEAATNVTRRVEAATENQVKLINDLRDALREPSLEGLDSAIESLSNVSSQLNTVIGESAPQDGGRRGGKRHGKRGGKKTVKKHRRGGKHTKRH
jgi:hypothetical protein